MKVTDKMPNETTKAKRVHYINAKYIAGRKKKYFFRGGEGGRGSKTIPYETDGVHKNAVEVGRQDAGMAGHVQRGEQLHTGGFRWIV
jgi:hypothetical protein